MVVVVVVVSAEGLDQVRILKEVVAFDIGAGKMLATGITHASLFLDLTVKTVKMKKASG